MDDDDRNVGRDGIQFLNGRVAQFRKLAVVIAEADDKAGLFDRFDICFHPCT